MAWFSAVHLEGALTHGQSGMSPEALHDCCDQGTCAVNEDRGAGRGYDRPDHRDDGARVLMIDDDRKLCRLVAACLKPLGFEVTAVHTGNEGLARALAADDRWHAIVLDLMLPAMNGLEVLRRIRMHSAVPVFIFTACGDELHRGAVLQLGATECLPKSQSEQLALRLCRLA